MIYWTNCGRYITIAIRANEGKYNIKEHFSV